MVEIDWVEIPGGEFLIGISERQAEDIRARVRAECGVDRLDVHTRALVEGVVEKLHLSVAGKIDLATALSPEEKEVDRNPQVRNVFMIELELRHLMPQRVARLDTFYIARFPVTSEQADEFMASDYAYQYKKVRVRSSRRMRVPSLPWAADWHDADLFSHWVGGRPPTALEWEKAARGTDGRLYPWGDEWDVSRGNFIRDTNAPGRPQMTPWPGTWMTPVDSYPSGVSPYGVWDMAGNVREWTMSMKWISGTGEEVPIVKAYPVKFTDFTPWFDHLLAREGYGDLDKGFYVGFRPVMDKWQRKLWESVPVDAVPKDVGNQS
jgi:formylglycine-generating enzyme required for sulfatase activity